MKATAVKERGAGLWRWATGWYHEATEWERQQEAAAAQPRALLPAPSDDDAEVLYLDSARQARPVASVTLQRVGLLDGLRRLLDEEALIVLGPKGSGKTTLSLALLNAVIAAGHHVAIIDPHADLNPWPEGITKYGSGLDYAEIDRVLRLLFDEMKLRYQRGQEGRRAPLYVFIDEVPSIRDECPSWSKVFAKLLREARKVNIHLVVLSQSFLVEDLGINGDTRNGLMVVALGKAVTRYLSKAQHINEREKQALIEATRGLSRPAIIDSGDVPAIFEVTGADRVQTRMEPRPWRFEMEDDNELLEGLLVGSPHTGITGLEVRQKAEISPSAQTSMAGIADTEAVNGGMRRLGVILAGLSRDDKIAALVALGVSANAIVAAVGGDRNGVLARVRELRGGQDG